jgi:hypothetical protein
MTELLNNLDCIQADFRLACPMYGILQGSMCACVKAKTALYTEKLGLLEQTRRRNIENNREALGGLSLWLF